MTPKVRPTIRPWAEATGEQKIAITALMLEELGSAQALVMIHGVRRGAQRYIEVGGHMRFDEDGEVVVLHDGVWWRTA